MHTVCNDRPAKDEDARQVAINNNLDEYLSIANGRHWRRHVGTGALIAKANYQIDFWHALVRRTER